MTQKNFICLKICFCAPVVNSPLSISAQSVSPSWKCYCFNRWTPQCRPRSCRHWGKSIWNVSEISAPMELEADGGRSGKKIPGSLWGSYWVLLCGVTSQDMGNGTGKVARGGGCGNTAMRKKGKFSVVCTICSKATNYLFYPCRSTDLRRTRSCLTVLTWWIVAHQMKKPDRRVRQCWSTNCSAVRNLDFVCSTSTQVRRTFCSHGIVFRRL